MMDPKYYFSTVLTKPVNRVKLEKVSFQKQVMEGTLCILYTLNIPWPKAVALRSSQKVSRDQE